MTGSELLDVFLATLPILVLILTLGVFRVPSWIASLGALALAALLAVLRFSMPVAGVLEASLEGVMLGLFPILWVIVSALFVYNTTLETGGMDRIRSMLSGLSPDRRVQGLLLAFAFGGFLEAVAGFGTSVAIPAGILVAMGFDPFRAAVVCLIANTVPVAFGVLGVPITTLAQVTGLATDRLSLFTALQLFPLAVLLPLVLVGVIAGGVKGIRGVTGLSIAAGAAFSLFQTVTAWAVGPELAAVVGSIAAMLAILGWLRFRPVRSPWRFPGEDAETGASTPDGASRPTVREALQAWSPYLIVLVLVFAVRFLPFLSFLNESPFTVSHQFYHGEGGKPMSFALATSAGTNLFIAAVAGGLIQGASFRRLVGVFAKTLRQCERTIATVLAIVALAKLMGYSGMVAGIASALASLAGGFYPLVAPFIGMVGTFITGSDTSANVLFGNLQRETAVRLGMDPVWLTAANAAGATLGKMISPQSISIAASATRLGKREGRLLGATFLYCLAFAVVMGVLVYAFS
ncbi:MAG: L-lactate permease [Clostridia bacterium]|nr:L-lactate permease [Clostridia bacterium]